MLNKENFKNIAKIIIFNLLILIFLTTKVQAHGGNITGWKEKNSSEIIKYEEKYFGYHKENGNIHYHEVKWNEEKEKWEIVNPAVYYDKNFQVITKNTFKTEKKEVKYLRGVDGDTAKFLKDDKEITVRFLGINTPETVDKNRPEEPFGKEASNFTKQKLENANKIEIEYDENSQKQDKYNRDLAWIWVDDRLLQEEIVLNGLAKTYMLQNNYKYAGKLQVAQNEAKEKKIGVWTLEKKENNIKGKDKNSSSNQLRIVILIIVAIILIIFGKNKRSNIKILKRIDKKLKK